MSAKDSKHSTGEARLVAALELIGVQGDEPSHHRYGLLDAIHTFAVLKRDSEMEQATEKGMMLIRTANQHVADST